ncbi:MAG TPA: RNA methyltransferase [Cytophagales bacterium]|nr:RNA methyltransferase [Cytophagales bacterium]
MEPFQTPSTLVITCNKRLAPFLRMEVEAQGFAVDRQFSTGVELKGTMTDCIRLNLTLRCASQVLYSLKKFKANSPEDVYDVLIRMPWEKVIPAEGYVSVTSTVDHFTVNNNLFVNVKVKDAIADRFRREKGKRPNSGPSLDQAVVHLFWKEEDAEIFIDTSGHTLAKHGYRKIPGKAPMLEALAAATVLATKWDRKSPFVNPMCGSSTVAIEALMLATNRYPGLFRTNYAFMHFLGYDPGVYAAERLRLESLVTEVPGLRVIATDISEDAIQISKVNAGVAGVESLMEFAVCDFAETVLPEPPGIIYFNPEYGERLGDVTALETTYAQIGDFLKKKCAGYTGYVFTGNLELAKKIGLKASRRIEFYTSQIDCRLLEYELYAGTRRVPREGD